MTRTTNVRTWRKKEQSMKTVFLTFDLASCRSESAGTSPEPSSSPGETVGEQCEDLYSFLCVWYPLTYFHFLFCQLQGSLWWHVVSLLLLHKGGKVGREGSAWCVIPHWEEVSHIHTVKHPLGLYIVPIAEEERGKSFSDQIPFHKLK